MTHACFDVYESRNLPNISLLHCALCSQLWLSKRPQNQAPVTTRRNQIPLQSSFQQNWSLRPINRTGLAELTVSKNAVQWLNGRSNFPTGWQLYGGDDPVDNMSRTLRGEEVVGFVHERDIIFTQCFLKLFYCFCIEQCTGSYLHLHNLDCANIAFPVYSTY